MAKKARTKAIPQPLPTSKYTKWRAFTLTMVYVLISLHVAHWLIAGKTLAPLELHEVMFTAELGIVTAGFLLMLLVTIATFIFGRFFCSWGCHMMTLQEYSSWLLKKLKVRPRMIRSRILLFVPPLVLLYMFGWPQIVRMWEGRAFPALRTQTDLDGISSFVTTDFWRNLPDPWITALTFLVCGFLIVYVLGSRAFCTYGCPYGVLFMIADRFAPGRIVVDDKCAQCGTCTAVCTSDVRVHEEVAKHGTIVNPRCLKDLDCVSSCPENALHYGWTRPTFRRLYEGRWILLSLALFAVALLVALFWPGAQQWWAGRFDLVPFLMAAGLLGIVAYARSGMPERTYHFSALEELLMAVVFVATLAVYRQLYDAIPFLLTIGLGGAVAYAVAVFLRLFHRPNVEIIDRALKRNGRLRPAGRVFATLMVLFLAFSVHSGMVQYHKHLGYAGFERYRVATSLGDPQAAPLAEQAIGHLEWTERWGLFRSLRLEEKLATLYLGREEWGKAEEHLRRIVERAPLNAEALTDLGQCLVRRGEYAQAEAHLEKVLAVDATSRAGKEHLREVRANAMYYLAVAHTEQGRPAEAEAALRDALRLAPELPEAHYNLGALLLESGRSEEGEGHLREAIRLEPEMAAAHYNLGVALFYQARLDEAIASVERSLALDPSDPQAREFLAHLRRQRGGSAPEGPGSE